LEWDVSEKLPDSIEDLDRILLVYGIDTSAWGGAGLKSVKHLFDEIVAGKCRLKSSRNGCKPGIERHVHLCIARIRAFTSKGMRDLKYRSVYDDSIGQQTFADRDCTKKLRSHVAEDRDFEVMLFSELQLPVEWQNEHLILESMETRPLQEVQGHGDSPPGLTTRYTFSVATFQVQDAFAPEIAGMLALPQADDFTITEGNKTRCWTWAAPTIDDPQPARPG
jgi:hypothetical protein